MRTERELIEHITEKATDQWAMSELRLQLKPIAKLLVTQTLHARRNGNAQSQPNTAPLLSRMAQIIADVFCDEGVHECWRCGTVGIEDEMHDHSDAYRDQWICDDCLQTPADDPDRAYDSMVDRECELTGSVR